MGMEHYQHVKDLGGTSGAFLARDKQDPKRYVVIKQLEPGAEGMEELSVSLRVQHPHIIQFQESFSFDGSLYVVLRYEKGGDLEKFLSRLAGLHRVPTERTVWMWAGQLLEAVRFCHDKRIMHRDIKPGNIFLSEDTRSLFLGDFGSAKSMPIAGDPFTCTFVGTPLWISPEVLQGEAYSYPTDIWSIGCVLYEMATLEKPFSSVNFAKLVHQITAGEVHPLPSTVSPALQKLIMSMLQLDPSKRPSAAEALATVRAALAETEKREVPRPSVERRRREEEEETQLHVPKAIAVPVATAAAVPAAPSKAPLPKEARGVMKAEEKISNNSPENKKIPPQKIEGLVGRPPSGRAAPRNGRRPSLTGASSSPAGNRPPSAKGSAPQTRHAAPVRSRPAGGEPTPQPAAAAADKSSQEPHRRQVSRGGPPDRLPMRAAQQQRVGRVSPQPALPLRLDGLAARRLTPLQLQQQQNGGGSSPKHPKTQPQGSSINVTVPGSHQSNSLPSSLTRPPPGGPAAPAGAFQRCVSAELPFRRESRPQNVPARQQPPDKEPAPPGNHLVDTQWARDKKDDVSAIEDYLHKFRDKDEAVLRQVDHPHPPSTGGPYHQVGSRPANLARPNRLEAVDHVVLAPKGQQQQEQPPAPAPAPVVAQPKIVREQQQLKPPMPKPTPTRSPASHPHNVPPPDPDGPTPLYEHRRKMKALQHQQRLEEQHAKKYASPSRGAPQQAGGNRPLVDPEVAERAKNHLRSHQPHQVSHAYPTRTLSEEEKKKVEAERRQAQAQREQERVEMRRQIQRARLHHKAKDIQVENNQRQQFGLRGLTGYTGKCQPGRKGQTDEIIHEIIFLLLVAYCHSMQSPPPLPFFSCLTLNEDRRDTKTAAATTTTTGMIACKSRRLLTRLELKQTNKQQQQQQQQQKIIIKRYPNQGYPTLGHDSGSDSMPPSLSVSVNALADGIEHAADPSCDTLYFTKEPLDNVVTLDYSQGSDAALQPYATAIFKVKCTAPQSFHVVPCYGAVLLRDEAGEKPMGYTGGGITFSLIRKDGVRPPTSERFSVEYHVLQQEPVTFKKVSESLADPTQQAHTAKWAWSLVSSQALPRAHVGPKLSIPLKMVLEGVEKLTIPSNARLVPRSRSGAAAPGDAAEIRGLREATRSMQQVMHSAVEGTRQSERHNARQAAATATPTVSSPPEGGEMTVAGVLWLRSARHRMRPIPKERGGVRFIVVAGLVFLMLLFTMLYSVSGARSLQSSEGNAYPTAEDLYSLGSQGPCYALQETTDAFLRMDRFIFLFRLLNYSCFKILPILILILLLIVYTCTSLFARV
eukprot:gene2167-1336_t